MSRLLLLGLTATATTLPALLSQHRRVRRERGGSATRPGGPRDAAGPG